VIAKPGILRHSVAKILNASGPALASIVAVHVPSVDVAVMPPTVEGLHVANVFTVKNWFKKTPENFKFTAKFPKVITHDKRLKDVSRELKYFIQSMLPLKEKTLALLIQLPPSLKITEGIGNTRLFHISIS
jgi:Protein of unknown function DUF72